LHQKSHIKTGENNFGKLVALLFLLLVSSQLMAQYREAENWLVGNNWLNFSGGGEPSVIQPAQPLGYQSSTCISDKNGQLLFYHDGLYVRNRQQQLMPYCFNDGIYYQQLFSASAGLSVQGNIIVPWPGNDSLYIIFHIFHQSLNNKASPLLYSVINVKHNSGLGDVVQPNILLLNTDATIKLSAVLHCNKKDVWVVGHLKNSDKYFAYLVTAAGISPTPVYSNCNFIPGGIDVTGFDNSHYGTMKISPQGDKLAAAHMGRDFIELCDFNNQTGVVSNPKQLKMKPAHAYYDISLSGSGIYCVEFSPSGHYLYANGIYNSYWPPLNSDRAVGRIVQFDASQPTEATIQSSMYLVDTIFIGGYNSMQLANNGKIYLNSSGSAFSCITNPEATGIGCNFSENYTPAFSSTQGSLPNFIQSYFRYPVIATGNCMGQSISFSIQNLVGVSSISWNFGDPASGINNTSSLQNPNHSFTSTGTYTVTAILQNSNGCAADTITKLIHAGALTINLGNDTAICSRDTLQLQPIPVINGSSLLWSNGNTDTVLKVTQPGQYWLRASAGGCNAVDTINITLRSLPQFTLGNDSLICGNTSVPLAPSPAQTGTYTWSNNAATPTINVSNAGSYWLQIIDGFGCKWRDTVAVGFKTLPNFNLGNDTTICQQDTLLLNAAISGATGYTWNTGATTPQIKTYQSGIYWCDVNKQGCIYRDSIMLTVKPLPIANLGNDTTLCENTTLLLDAQNPGSSWMWNTGSMAQTYLVRQAGFYKVTVTNNNCINKDSINISYELLPRFSLGSDRLICPGEVITLQPMLNPLWQLMWQDGSGAVTYRVVQPGLYYLDATTRCGTTREDIVFTSGLCRVNIPNAFTPNGDGRNDVLKALGTEAVTSFDLKIFNRYGQLIFETKDKNKGWDGRYNGQRVNNGAYAYVCTYNEQNSVMKQILKGIVIIIR
jgi:gliding motility-associated-like protein